MLTISSGHSASYLTDQVAAGRENYYTGAVAAGEPPGRWYGAGAEALGLQGLVDTQDMTALYERFLDPRDEHFADPSKWMDVSTLGHTGRAYKSEEQLYAEALDAEPDASPERRAELQLDAGKKARKNVAFHDATFSVQKSVTVLHTAFEAQQVRAERMAADESLSQEKRADARTVAESWATHRQAVEDAIWAGNQAALNYLAEHAGYSRVGHHGGAAGRYVDAHDWVVASFFQHDSRDHDPQLHIHNAILNRVQGSDGQWRTMDGRALYAYRGAAAAVGERTTEEHLTRALAVRFAARPDGKAREIVGVAQNVMDLFSSRRRAITKHTQGLVEAFEAKFGREPNSLELDRLQRQATFATRNAKSHDGETVEARLERWDREMRAEVATGLASVSTTVLAEGGQHRPATHWSPSTVIETAFADVQAKKAAWTESDLARAISDALPDELGGLTGPQVTQLIEGLTSEALTLAVPLDAARPAEEVLPDGLRVANGRSCYEAPGQRLYATPEHVRTERSLIAAAADRGAPALASHHVDQFVTHLSAVGVTLGMDQAAAVRGVLTSGAKVESLVGPAGTGKSFVVGALAKAWQDPALWEGQQHRVVGLAASQIATDVLAGEGVSARNIARWLATQQRLSEGSTVENDQQWQLHAGDLVVVDESAMANTADLAAIHARATAAGAKLLLTGDHRQLAAVGAGGAMDLVAHAGVAYELAEARRFTHAWERDASLRLRSADRSVVDEYHKQGRLIDAGTRADAETSAARAWLADTLSGQQSLLIVDTNEQAARLSAQLRAELVRLGKVTDTGVPLGMQGTYAGVGDLVQARRNGWELAGFEGNQRCPINREQYRVLDTREDGGLVVAPVGDRAGGADRVDGERITLPGAYVSQHMALGYASTVHAAQGLTVDTSHSVTTPGTGADAFYVAMTRGRNTNTAHVTTTTTYGSLSPQTGESTGLAVPVERVEGSDAGQDAVHRAARVVVDSILETAEPDRSAIAQADESAIEAASLRTAVELLNDGIEYATAGRTTRLLDELVDTGVLSAFDRVRLAAEDGGATLSQVLRRAEVAGYDPRQVLTDAVQQGSLTDARLLTNVIHHRITEATGLDPQGRSFRDWAPTVEDPQDQRYLSTLTERAETRRAELGDQVAAQQPQWAIESLGPLPVDPADRAVWIDKAATVAAHRELTGYTDPTQALGPPPKPGQVIEYACWRAGWDALDRPATTRAEQEMSTGQLHVRVRAANREAAWAPPFVADKLAGARQAAQARHQTAAILTAEADNTHDPTQRQQLIQQAAGAEAVAGVFDQQAQQLEKDDAARGAWLVETIHTRAAADRAKHELAARGATAPEDVTTAQEWLAAHQQAMREEDAYREITDDTDLADLADATADRDHDQRHGDAVVETGVADIREHAAAQPAPVDEDAVPVRSAQQTADSTDRARQALLEIQQRQAIEEQRLANEARMQELARWHHDDMAASVVADLAAQDEREPVA